MWAKAGGTTLKELYYKIAGKYITFNANEQDNSRYRRQICDSFNLSVVELLLLGKSTNEADKQTKIKAVTNKLAKLTQKQIDFIEDIIISLIEHS